MFVISGISLYQIFLYRVCIVLMPRSHLHVTVRPVRATYDTLRKIEWNVAISWQLRGLCGYYRGPRPALFRGNSKKPSVARMKQIYV